MRRNLIIGIAHFFVNWLVVGIILNSPTPVPSPISEMNGVSVIPTEWPIALDVAERIAILAEKDCQSQAGSDRGIWRGDPVWLFGNGEAVWHLEILPSLTLREFTPDSNGKFPTKPNTFRIGPLVRMTPAVDQFIGTRGPVEEGSEFVGIPQSQAERGDPPMAAVAGDHPISVSRVQRHLEKTLGKLAVPESLTPQANAEALEHLIRRHVVFTAIKKSGANAGESLVLMEIDKLNDRLKEVDQSLEDYLRKAGLTKPELEYEFEWRIAWRKYLDKNLTDERLQKYFENHRRQFDGTELKVAHLLIQNLKQDISANHELARRIKDEIGAGKISWEAAVSKYSDAKSSSDDGGEIGWIAFDGPMPPEFCQAAINLQRDQISAPVETVFGIHLIKCLEIKPGTIGPRDAKEEVREAATQFLFDSLAEKNRDAMEIKYLVDWPLPKKAD